MECDCEDSDDPYGKKCDKSEEDGGSLPHFWCIVDGCGGGLESQDGGASEEVEDSCGDGGDSPFILCGYAHGKDGDKEREVEPFCQFGANCDGDPDDERDGGGTEACGRQYAVKDGGNEEPPKEQP